MPTGGPRLCDAYWQVLHDVGAHLVPHSGRTLLDHLRGTYALLTQWGSDEVTCTAGLFHSIYGTQTFVPSLVDYNQRDHVRKKIGVATERLVFLFSTIDRDVFFENIGVKDVSLWNKVDGEPIDVSPETLNALVEIEVANILEQIPHKKRISPKIMDIYIRQCTAAKPVIPDKAFRQCVRVFGRHLSDIGLHRLRS